MKQQWKNHKPLLAALTTLVVLLAGVVLIWLAQVRPNVGKGRSEIRIAYVLKQADLERAMDLLALGIRRYNAR